MITKEELFALRKEKLRKEIESAQRLLKKGIEPLKIADQFIHDMFKLMEDGISRRNPHLNKNEVRQKIRDNLKLAENIKSHRKRGRNYWPKSS